MFMMFITYSPESLLFEYKHYIDIWLNSLSITNDYENEEKSEIEGLRHKRHFKELWIRESEIEGLRHDTLRSYGLANPVT